MAIASMSTTNEGTTEFRAHFALLKRNVKHVFVDRSQKISLIKANKQALFWKFETRTNRVLKRVNRASSICLLI